LQCSSASHNNDNDTAQLVTLSNASQGAQQAYHLNLIGHPLPADILCLAVYDPTQQLNIKAWANDDLRALQNRYTHTVALLEGGILALSLFVLILAIADRQPIYLLLSAWLLGNLRVGFMALGWDAQWLTCSVPAQWLPLTQRVTLAVHFLISYALLSQLLRHTLGPLPLHVLRNALGIAGLMLLVGAFFIPALAFTSAMWSLSLIGLGTCVAIIIHGAKHSRTTEIRLWHLVLVSMAVCLLISCVIFLFSGSNHFSDLLNGMVALLLSNVMAALAIGDRIYRERQAHHTTLATPAIDQTIIPVGLFKLNAYDEIVQSNALFKQLMDLEANDHRHYPWTQLFPPLDWNTVVHQSKSGDDTEIRRLENTKDTLARSFLLRAVHDGVYIEGSLRDISARTQAIQELEQIVDSDPITNVLNQRGMEKALNASLARLQEGDNCILAYLNLNYDKYANGTYGRRYSDALLREVSSRIEALLQPDQDIGRISRDEFIITFHNATVDEAQAAAESIISALNEETITVGNRSVNLQSSIGLVEVSAGAKAEDVLSAANRACRDALREHKAVVAYKQGSQELHDHAEELRLFKELEGGSSSAFYLEMQPIMSLSDPLGSLNYEILLRVRDSHGKLIPTGKVICAAEESGTISIIDKWVVGATLEWLEKHHTQLKRVQQININLSGVSLNEDKFIEDLFHILSQYEPLCHYLCIEITEGVALQDLERTRGFMKRLQGMGAQIALDDFGAGYTSFSYLRELPADLIKIDGALIQDMLRRNTNIAIVRTIVELARNLGMRSIAEWVEDVDTLRLLHQLKVDYIQGFVIAGAKAPAEILNATDIRDLVSDPDVRAFIEERYRNKT